jgi:hypothetical protein
MLKIQTPKSYEPERRYILSVMLSEFLGLTYQFQPEERRDVRITTGDEKELILADGLFSVPEEHWLKPASLPKLPLKLWNLTTTPINVKIVDQSVPVIYGEDPYLSGFFVLSTENIYLGLDIFGSAFFMLTRCEEVVKPERDSRNRFPAYASLAYQEGFLDRPIVNEYLEILWTCLIHLCPGLQRKLRYFQIYASHDVDVPFAFAMTNPIQLAKECIRMATKDHSLLIPARNARQWFGVKIRGAETDPYNTFNMIMDISEKHNLKSAFYFITDHRAGGIDDDYYYMMHPLILDLLCKIYQRGHEIGLHLSYNTYRDAAQTKKEFDHLKRICASLEIKQALWGNRQHYLRWETPTTFQNLDDAGLDYDTTLSFADTAGFRCGICYEFSTFNIVTRQQLRVTERPLIVMDGTILDKHYMNLGTEYGTALQTILKYKNRCQIFNGDFTILWHNNRFVKEREIELYEQVIA